MSYVPKWDRWDQMMRGEPARPVVVHPPAAVLPPRAKLLSEEADYHFGRSSRDESDVAPNPVPITGREREHRLRLQGWYDRDRELKGKQ